MKHHDWTGRDGNMALWGGWSVRLVEGDRCRRMETNGLSVLAQIGIWGKASKWHNDEKRK
jgi:hypothetical protein